MATALIAKTRGEVESIALMAEEVRAGLGSVFPSLPSKYFYDDRGSLLFEEITKLPEYYQTRTEESILEGVAGEVVDRVAPRELVELGSGVGRKIRLLLDAMDRRNFLERCVLFDINERVLTESVKGLAADYPRLEARGVVGDFQRDLAAIGRGTARLMVFLAGTIGNLEPDEVPGFLAAAASCLSAGDGFLVGVDLVKDERTLWAAYNDSAGVTAAFNLNILRVINERLGANFDPTAFEHVAFYDQARSWIEMRLRARRPCRVSIPRPRFERTFEAGEEIRTEISCKYTEATFGAKLVGTGLVLDRFFTDPGRLFALALLRRP
jgi:L-histidine N-alpha-methyltransferase